MKNSNQIRRSPRRHILRLVRHLFRCRHDYWTTATNGWYIPIEEHCQKCGEYRHRVLKAARLGIEKGEWTHGRHPKTPPETSPPNA